MAAFTLRRSNLNGRRFHTENASKSLFPFTLRRRNLKTAVSLWKRIKIIFLSTLLWSCVGGQLALGSHMIIVTPSFWKSSTSEIHSVHTKTKKPAFSNSSGVVWTLPKTVTGIECLSFVNKAKPAVVHYWRSTAIGCYNIAGRATQSNSVYVSVLQISTVLTDGVSKSLCQKIFFARAAIVSAGKNIIFR